MHLSLQRNPVTRVETEAPPVQKKIAMKTKTAPKHLSPRIKKWWRSVTAEFELDEHHVLSLQNACELWDRAQDARRIVEAEGGIVRDRFGMSRENPASKLERDSKIAFSRILRELALDVEGPEETPRPPALGSGRRRN